MHIRSVAFLSLLPLVACASAASPENVGDDERASSTLATASDPPRLATSESKIADKEEIPLNHVFVTTGLYNGDLRAQGAGVDGPSGANNLCNIEAASAGLPGSYKAMLFQTRPGINGIGNWRNVLGQIVFPNLAAVKNGPAQLTLLVTATGASVPSSDTIWSGILPNDAAGAACTRNGQPWSHDGSGLDGSLKTGHVTNLSTLSTWPRGDVPRHCALKRRLFCVRSY